MKKITTYILSSLLLSTPALCQENTSNTDKTIAMASTSHDVEIKADAISTRWKDERASQRHEFYNAKTAFDPAAEYETIYTRSASSTMNAKNERGNLKLMEGNNKVPIAYYNNACVGTIIKLTNPNNGKVTYAIVVGKVPPAEANSCLLMVSERSARSLEIKDYSSVELTCYTGQ